MENYFHAGLYFSSIVQRIAADISAPPNTWDKSRYLTHTGAETGRIMALLGEEGTAINHNYC